MIRVKIKGPIKTYKYRRFLRKYLEQQLNSPKIQEIIEKAIKKRVLNKLFSWGKTWVKLPDENI